MSSMHARWRSFAAPQPVGELSGVSFGDLSVDEEPEAFLERQVLDLGRGELFGQRLGHGGASKLVELSRWWDE